MNASISRVPIGAIAAAAIILGQVSTGFAQTKTVWAWSVRDLTPPNAFAYLNAVGEKTQVGTVSFILDGPWPGLGVPTRNQPGYWRGTRESFTDFELDAGGGRYAQIRAASGETLAGDFEPASSRPGETHAAIWPSASGPVIDLNPAGYGLSRISATNGQQHVGYATVDPYISGSVSIPMLWTGTSARPVILPLPPGAKGAGASAISSTQQGGVAGFGNIGEVFEYSASSHAILWNGANGRAVDLHPPTATESRILAMTDTYQAGEVNYCTKYDQRQAAIWFGSPDSVRILAAPGSSVYGSSGPYQIGATTVAGQSHATMWNSSASSAIDLHALLPAGFVSSSAYHIWTDGDKIVIGGSASIYEDGGWDFVWADHAMLWIFGPVVSPTFTGVPQSITVSAGQSFVLAASVTASDPISFQWQRDGTDILGATGAILRDSRPGAYTVIAKNIAGSIISPRAMVSVAGGPFIPASHLTNVSLRAWIGPDAPLAIAGFVIAGTTSKTVLVRAVGPGLSKLGVPGALSNPKLQVFSGSALWFENDDWSGDALLVSIGESVGAFPVADASSKDAMLAVTLPPGSYTAQVSGVERATGTVLVEIYEVL
jgi:hypothetical protein